MTVAFSSKVQKRMNKNVIKALKCAASSEAAVNGFYHFNMVLPKARNQAKLEEKDVEKRLAKSTKKPTAKSAKA